MGVFSKLKGIFYDEVEVESDDELKKIDKSVKKEKTKEKIEVEEKPKIEEIKYKTVEIEPEDDDKVEVESVPKTDNTFSERDLFRSDRTFDIIQFDDDEEEEEPPKRNVLNENNRSTRIESPAIPETPRVFKPSPIISPIFGILDKDYKKEEISSKPTTNETVKSNVTSYDTVRRKAYGTLEDELEDTLNSMNKISTKTINEEISKVDKDVDLLEQKTQKIEDLITKIEEETTKVDEEATVGDLEDKLELDNFEEEEEKKVSDNTLEHDLFNLIDSMYDDKEI